MSVKFKKLVTIIAVWFLVVASFVLAGQTANNSTPEPTGYTLEDIYNLIENSTTTGHTLFPTTTTGEPTMHSVSEIYVALANLIDPTKLASTSVTYLGVSSGDTPEEVAAVTKEFTPTSEPGAITGFTLQDITNLIENIRATTSAHISFSPASGPADSGPTITEIYESLSALIQAGDIATGTTYLGVVGNYEVGPRTLYFKDLQETPDYAWDTVANWWTDAECTTPAGSTPNDWETVYIAGEMTSGPGATTTVSHIYVADTSTGGGNFRAVLTQAVGDATFYNSGYNQGVINGDVVFNDNSFNDGVIYGDVTFNDNSANRYSGVVNGNAILNDSSFNDVSCVIDGNADVYYPSSKPIGGTVVGTITYHNYPAPCSGLPIELFQSNGCNTLARFNQSLCAQYTPPCYWDEIEFDCAGSLTCSEISDQTLCTDVGCTWSE